MWLGASLYSQFCKMYLQSADVSLPHISVHNDPSRSKHEFLLRLFFCCIRCGPLFPLAPQRRGQYQKIYFEPYYQNLTSKVEYTQSN